MIFLSPRHAQHLVKSVNLLRSFSAVITQNSFAIVNMLTKEFNSQLRKQLPSTDFKIKISNTDDNSFTMSLTAKSFSAVGNTNLLSHPALKNTLLNSITHLSAKTTLTIVEESFQYATIPNNDTPDENFQCCWYDVNMKISSLFYTADNIIELGGETSQPSNH